MRVLLVIPSVDTSWECVPSMGLMNLYLIGKELGCDMELIDLSEVLYREGLGRILSKRYDIVGISCNFINAAPSCIQYAKDIKERYPNTLLISGGNHATLVPEDLLFNDYDYVIYGEGETTFREFLQISLRGESTKELKGISYLKEGRIIKNHPREPIEDLDTLPLNDYSEFNLEPYFKRSGLRYATMETSRGCVYNCAFCSTVSMWGHKYRHKSPQRILEEFKIAKKLKLDFVHIYDDDVAFNEQNLRGFCNLLINEEICIPWAIGIGTNSIKDESTFDLLVKSNCIQVNVNIESANARLLKAYRKPHTIEDNRRLCEKLHRRRIIIENHGLIGFPDETIRETLNTYFYLIKTSHTWIVTFLEPRPGSDYWKNWDGRGDILKYRLFGKANVFWGKHKLIIFLIYRIFVLFYLLNPTRIWKSLFARNKAIRYSYKRRYYVARKILRLNITGFLRRIYNFCEEYKI